MLRRPTRVTAAVFACRAGCLPRIPGIDGNLAGVGVVALGLFGRPFLHAGVAGERPQFLHFAVGAFVFDVLAAPGEPSGDVLGGGFAFAQALEPLGGGGDQGFFAGVGRGGSWREVSRGAGLSARGVEPQSAMHQGALDVDAHHAFGDADDLRNVGHGAIAEAGAGKRRRGSAAAVRP